MVKRLSLVIIGLFLMTVGPLSAQSWGTNPLLNDFANSYVKSLDEFMHRFNGEELHPGIASADDVDVRKKSILTLFDWQGFSDRDTIKAAAAVEFADAVQKSGATIGFTSPLMYAEAECLFKFKNKEIQLSLILKYENIRDDYYRWAIVGANGLEFEGLIDTARDGYINPVQSDLHFSDLQMAFPKLDRYLSKDGRVDQLSFIMGMATSGMLEFKVCQNVRYHFLDISGYIFTVGLHARLDNNAGWLIDNVMRATHQQKEEYIKYLVGE